VTDPNARNPRLGMKLAVPRTSVEFVEYFKTSPLNEWNREDMESYRMMYVGQQECNKIYKQSAQAERAHKHSPFMLSVPRQ
jgi:hypothetical protein